MASPFVRTEFRGQVLKVLRRLEDAADDTKPAMASVGRALTARVELGFRRGEDPWGSAWDSVRRGGQPLRDSGRLARSITPDADADGVTLGTNVLYAPVHQFGATIRAKNHPFLTFKVGERWVKKKAVEIPARPFFPVRGGDVDLPEAWAGDVLRILTDHLRRAEA